LDSYDIDDLIDVDTLSRPTEEAAFIREARSRKLAWRVERWGEVMLTEREHEAMTLEMDAIHERSQAYKEAEDDANRHYKASMDYDRERNSVLFGFRRQMGWYQADRDVLHAQLVKRINRGIQAQIARRLSVSERRVRQLLSSASLVMEALQDTLPFAGWKVEHKKHKRVYTLVARVAVTEKSGQVIIGNFAPVPIEKAA
jgi:hypothetical protein